MKGNLIDMKKILMIVIPMYDVVVQEISSLYLT